MDSYEKNRRQWEDYAMQHIKPEQGVSIDLMAA
jgi:hypothetical protein